MALLVAVLSACEGLVDDPTAGARDATVAVVSGYEAMLASDLATDAAMGEVLLGELNCLSCHAATDADVAERITTKPAPDLRDVGERASAAWIADFVADPTALKPGTTMPAMLASYDDAERTELAELITHFLVDQSSQPRPSPYNPLRFGAMVERGRALFHGVGCAACHAGEGVSGTPVDAGRAAAEPGGEEFRRRPARFPHESAARSPWLAYAVVVPFRGRGD